MNQQYSVLASIGISLLCSPTFNDSLSNFKNGCCCCCCCCCCCFLLCYRYPNVCLFTMLCVFLPKKTSFCQTSKKQNNLCSFIKERNSSKRVIHKRSVKPGKL